MKRKKLPILCIEFENTIAIKEDGKWVIKKTTAMDINSLSKSYRIYVYSIYAKDKISIKKINKFLDKHNILFDKILLKPDVVCIIGNSMFNYSPSLNHHAFSDFLSKLRESGFDYNKVKKLLERF